MKKKQKIAELERRVASLEVQIAALRMKLYEPITQPLFPHYPVTCETRWEWRPDTAAKYSA